VNLSQTDNYHLNTMR